MARSTMEVAFLGTQKTEMEGAKYVKGLLRRRTGRQDRARPVDHRHGGSG